MTTVSTSVAMASTTAMAVMSGSPVMMILSGGPLDGESQIVEMLPTTPGDELIFNIPHYQTFDPTGEVVLNTGLQVTYAIVGSGPAPGVGDRWVSSWILSFVEEIYVPAPAPLPPPGPMPPVAMTQVWMSASTTLTPDTLPVVVSPPPRTVAMAAQSGMTVDSEPVETGLVAMSAMSVMSVTPDWSPQVAMTEQASLTVIPDWTPTVTMAAQESLVLGVSVANYEAMILASNPLGYWPLDDPVGSTSARELIAGRFAVAHQTGNQQLPIFGVPDPWGNPSAVRFQWTTGQPTQGERGLTVMPAPPLTTQQKWSMEGWLRVTFPGPSNSFYGNETFLGFIDPTNAFPALFIPGASGNTQPLAFVSGSGGGAVGTGLCVHDGNWHHWILTYDGVAKQQVVYLDGVQLATGSLGPYAGASMSAFGIGTRPNNNSPYVGWSMTGDACQVALYDRVLTLGEAQSHASNVPPLRQASQIATTTLTVGGFRSNKAAYESAVLASGPAVFWPLDDAVGTTSPVELIGGLVSTKYGTPTFGAIGPWGNPGAVSLNPQTSDALTAPYGGKWSTSQFTLECWAKVGPLAYENNAIAMQVASQGITTAGATLEPFNQFTSNRYGYYAPGGGAVFTPVSSVPVTNDGNWHHWCWTTVVNGSLQLYVDGVLVKTNVGTVNGAFTPSFFCIGAYANPNGTPSNYLFGGSLCQIAVYQRALPAAEIMAHYTAGTSGQYVHMAATSGLRVINAASAYRAAVLTSAPVDYWPLNDPAGSTSAAEVVQGRNAQVFGTVTFGVNTATDPWGGTGFARFDGTSGQLVEQTQEALSTGPFTIELWFRTSVGNAVLVELNASAVAAPSGSYSPSLSNWSSKRIDAFIFPAAGFEEVPTTADGNWHHTAVTFDGSTGVLYRDGAQVSNLSPTTRQGVAGYWRMGSGQRIASFLSGDMCHVAIYNRALPIAELTQHYNAAKPAAVSMAPTSGLVVATTFTTYRSLIQSAVPEVYWPLDDAVGTTAPVELMGGRNGTVVGGVTFGQNDPWGLAAAVKFDGSTGFIYESTFSPVNTAPWSIEAWYQTTAVSPSAGMLNYNATAGTAFPGGSFTPAIQLDTTGHLTGFGSGPSPSSITGALPSNDGAWHHCVFTWDGVRFTLFRDGVLVAQAATVNPIQAGALFTQIGISGNTNRGGWWNGQLCHVAHYNRVLSAAEIATHAAYH